MDEVAPPLYATIIYLAALQMLNLIAIRDYITFYFLEYKYKGYDYDTIIEPTFFLAANYFFFTYKKRYKKIVKRYENEPINRKHKVYNILFCWIYPILTFVFVIAMGYSVRNNIWLW